MVIAIIFCSLNNILSIHKKYVIFVQLKVFTREAYPFLEKTFLQKKHLMRNEFKL